MRCFVKTNLDAPADVVWAAVKRPATLVQVTRGFLRFSNTESLPPEWHAGTSFRTRFWFFHIIPAPWKHTLAVRQVEEADKLIVSNERGGPIRTWDHTIRVSPAPGGSIYSDEIEIQAGMLTALIWLYAHIFYRYRQARWRTLVKKAGALPAQSHPETQG